MSWDQILTGFIYLVVVLVLVVIGKWCFRHQVLVKRA